MEVLPVGHTEGYANLALTTAEVAVDFADYAGRYVSIEVGSGNLMYAWADPGQAAGSYLKGTTGDTTGIETGCCRYITAGSQQHDIVPLENSRLIIRAGVGLCDVRVLITSRAKVL